MKKIKTWSLHKKIILSIIFALVIIIISMGIQVAVNLGISSLPQRPAESINSGGSDRLVYYFGLQANGEALPSGIELTETFINSELSGTYDYLNGRYDVADFRMNSLVRLYYSYYSYLPDSTKQEIKDVMLNFKYWMDQGGADSMCYWSENHQILFSTEEYLVGQAFPNDVFTVDGKTGLEHMNMAMNRINAWMEQRYLYGFTEWYSNNYYPEDIGPMSNFIQFALDDEMVNHMKMIMDILWFDMASQSFKVSGIDPSGDPRTYYVFVSSSGRMYSDNRVSDDIGNRMRDYIDFIIQPDATKDFDNSWATSGNGFFQCFKQMTEAQNTDFEPFYEVPNIIKAVFDDDSAEKIIKSSQSLNVSELKGEGLLGQNDNQIMMQLNMEAFTNPDVIDNTIKYIARNNMFTNDFLNDFKLVNIWPLRLFGLLNGVSTLLNPATNGIAIERANVYTYKTDYFSMHTAQAYHAGDYGDQQAISQVNLANDLSVFTTQPAKIPRRDGTPTYWTGNGRNAYSVQEKNVNISIYNPPTKVGFMEPMIVSETTHAYFPVELFTEVDETHLSDGYIFGKKNDTYIVLIANNPLEFVPFETSNTEGNKDNMLVRGSVKNVLTQKYDLIQTGPGYHFFLTELSSSAVETIEQFKTRILANEVTFNRGLVEYQTVLYGETSSSILDAIYNRSFSIRGVIQDLEYQRYESAYVENNIVERKSDKISYSFNGYSLVLNYKENTRTVGN